MSSWQRMHAGDEGIRFLIRLRRSLSLLLSPPLLSLPSNYDRFYDCNMFVPLCTSVDFWPAHIVHDMLKTVWATVKWSPLSEQSPIKAHIPAKSFPAAPQILDVACVGFTVALGLARPKGTMDAEECAAASASLCKRGHTVDRTVASHHRLCSAQHSPHYHTHAQTYTRACGCIFLARGRKNRLFEKRVGWKSCG